MADAALSAFLQVVFQSLSSPILKEIGSFCGVDKELKKLTKKLLRIQAVLKDAEERQIKEEVVRIWLRDLKDIAYDVDDVLDEMATEILQSKMKDGTTCEDSQVRSFLSSLNPSSNRVLFRLALAPKINEIMVRLDEIAKERNDLRLREGDGGGWTGLGGRPQTSSFVNESHVFGREDDKKKIVELLVSDEGCDEELCVIPIVGMGGLGKTTLAQLVYNDEKVEKHFELRMWVYVSDDFDVRRITKAIIESATRKSSDLLDLDPLQVNLKELLGGKRFLLVFDDVWNDRWSDWDVLLGPIGIGTRGSKILVTTRSEKVSLIAGTVPAYHLEALSDDDCWFLFRRHAVEARNSDMPLELVAVGKEIVNKCQGLPLAVKTLSGLLRSKTNENEWDFILKSELWELPEDKNDILPSLRLSYHHLPAHLKRCFSYCSIFPKDHEYLKEKLVLLWVAEGFVQPRGRKKMEDTGYEYFDDLLSMSFFQYSHDDAWDGQSRYKMHGLIHDLAQSVAGDDCYRMEDNQSGGISKLARHSSLICRNSEPIDFSAFYEFQSIRTLLLLCEYRCRIEHVPQDLFLKLRRLRALDLSGTNITELSNSVGNLKHLRFLDLSGTRIKKLPESICELYNLQMLTLRNCSMLVELPKNTKNLFSLRHLTFDMYSQLISTPPRIGNLTILQTLSAFIVGKESGCGIEELKNLMNLQGKLIIWRLENAINVEETKAANLKNKQHLQELTLGWSGEGICDIQDERLEEEIIESLQPHWNLKELRIENYSGAKFPSWMREPSYYNLVSIGLYSCRKCQILPSIGKLPFLKYLFIDGMHAVKQITHEFCGDGIVQGFPSLETLQLTDMPHLEEWCGVEEGEMARLCQLTMSNCPKLRELPLLPSSLTKLYVGDCMELLSLPMLPSLSDLELRNCDELLLNSPPYFISLSSLTLSEIRKLKHLPKAFSRTLAALKDLVIEDCNELISLLEENGPCSLFSLERLAISRCPQLTCIPGEVLPTTLTYFQMSSCPNLKSLPEGLQKLTSLHDLEIWDCPQIVSLPEDGLPTVLNYLDIRECPVLEERCTKERGEDWKKIDHIPKIWINYEQIS